MPISETALDVLARHLAAENGHDVDAILATYAEDPVVVLNGGVFRGLDRVRQLHEGLGFGGAGDFDELRVDERARMVGDDAVAIEQTLTGVQNRDWHGVPATGRRFVAAVCTWYRFAPDGRLAREDVYLDVGQIRRQLADPVPRKIPEESKGSNG